MKQDPRNATLAELAASGRMLALDVEGTGTTPHLPVEIAIVTIESGAFTHLAHTLINPGVPISPYATKVHGLTDADVANAPSPAEIAPLIRNLIEGSVIVGHAIQQDLDMLRGIIPEVDFLPSRVIDTQRLSRNLLPDLASYRLEAVMAELGLDWDDHPVARSGKHTAVGDGAAAGKLLLSLVSRIPRERMDHLGRMSTVVMSPKRERHLREVLEARGGIEPPTGSPSP